MSYQPAPPVVGSFGLGSAYSSPPPVGVGSPYGDALSAVGLSPDNPDDMYTQLQSYFQDPVSFKNAQRNWRGTKDAITWSESPPGTAVLQWPFHWGLWMKNAPKSDAQIRAVFKIPDGTDTTAFLKQLYKVPANISNVQLHSESWEGPNVDKIVSDVVKDLKHVPWGTIIHDVQAAISVVPGLGTAVSEVVAAAETAYDSALALAHHNPLEAGLDAAYNFALGAIPGASALRSILDPVKNTLVSFGHIHEPVQGRILDDIISNVPDSPKFGKLSPRSIAASLAHLVVKKLGVKHGDATTPAAHTQAQIVTKNLGVKVPLQAPAAAAPAAAAPPVGRPHPIEHRPHRPHGKYAPYPR